MSDIKQKQEVGSINNGIFGVKTVSIENTEIANKITKPIKDLVAIYSPKNLYWSEVGKLNKGYNIVERHKAEKWLTRPGMRIATPQEVAEEYGL